MDDLTESEFLDALLRQGQERIRESAEQSEAERKDLEARGYDPKYELTWEIQKRLKDRVTTATPEDAALLEDAIKSLRDVEERLSRLWQDHRWCGE